MVDAVRQDQLSGAASGKVARLYLLAFVTIGSLFREEDAIRFRLG
jgi:hypothetical protein